MQNIKKFEGKDLIEFVEISTNLFPHTEKYVESDIWIIPNGYFDFKIMYDKTCLSTFYVHSFAKIEEGFNFTINSSKARKPYKFKPTKTYYELNLWVKDLKFILKLTEDEFEKFVTKNLFSVIIKLPMGYFFPKFMEIAEQKALEAWEESNRYQAAAKAPKNLAAEKLAKIKDSIKLLDSNVFDAIENFSDEKSIKNYIAKTYHPDAGGNGELFIKFWEIFENII